MRDGIQRLCTIFKENGWIKKNDLGQDGFSAEMDLIFNVDLPNIQREFLPILISAADTNEVKRADIATLVDFLPHPAGGEDGCALEVYNAVGESIAVVAVPISAVSVLRADEILSVRSLAPAT